MKVQDKMLDTKYTRFQLHRCEVLNEDLDDLPAERSPAADVPGSSMSSFVDYEPMDPTIFKAKLLSALDDRYAVKQSLYFGIGQDDRIFIHEHPSGTSFTLMYLSQVFEALEYDELSSEANWERCTNDSIYWRLYNNEGNVFVSSESESESDPESVPWIAPEADVGDVFAPLGWPIERYKPTGFHRATRYVCCIKSLPTQSPCG